MFPMGYSGSTENTTGWTCAICGEWVPTNTYHGCGGGFIPLPDGATVDAIKDVELHAKLDEIIKMLKKIVKE